MDENMQIFMLFLTFLVTLIIALIGGWLQEKGWNKVGTLLQAPCYLYVVAPIIMFVIMGYVGGFGMVAIILSDIASLFK